MKLMNMDEQIPEIFYVFIGQGKRKFNEINYHNYKLTKRIISSGFTNLMIDVSNKDNFIDGNIVYAPFIPNKTTFNSPSSHFMNVINGYNVEYILELNRYKYFRNFPSRFSCVYAFGDLKSCEHAASLFDWDLNNVKKFRLVKINTELDECVKVVKCNMQIVTRMWNCDISCFDEESIKNFANSYWNGTGQIVTKQLDINTKLVTYDYSDVLYEYLIEGMLEEIE